MASNVSFKPRLQALAQEALCLASSLIFKPWLQTLASNLDLNLGFKPWFQILASNLVFLLDLFKDVLHVCLCQRTAKLWSVKLRGWLDQKLAFWFSMSLAMNFICNWSTKQLSIFQFCNIWYICNTWKLKFCNIYYLYNLHFNIQATKTLTEEWRMRNFSSLHQKLF